MELDRSLDDHQQELLQEEMHYLAFSFSGLFQLHSEPKLQSVTQTFEKLQNSWVPKPPQLSSNPEKKLLFQSTL